MPERLNGPVSKTGVGATLPGVQIPLSPPLFNKINQSQSAFDFALHESLHKNFFLSLCFLASNAVFFTMLPLVGHPLLSSLVHKLTLFTIA